MRRIACVVVCALAAACHQSNSRRVVLLHTNDEHSHLLGFGPEADEFPIVATRAGTGAIVGGASRRSTILAQERQSEKTKKDRAHQDAIVELFDQEPDPISVIKWKEIFDFLEAATDRCEDVANLLEGVIVKHA